MDDVAPGILLEDDSRSIAKGLTSKTDRILSKTSFSPDGNSIAAGYSGGVLFWDVAARKRLIDESLSVKEGAVRSVAFNTNSKTIAVSPAGDTIG